jgi:hypothetical protein
MIINLWVLTQTPAPHDARKKIAAPIRLFANRAASRKPQI